MKKFSIFLCSALLVFGLVGTASAIPLDVESLRITRSDSLVTHSVEWNTFTDDRSPIGVAFGTDPTTLLNAPDKTISETLNLGDSLFLYTESFSSAQLFNDDTYFLFLGSSPEEEIAEFSFLDNAFSLTSISPGFTLEFLGFTTDSGLVHGYDGSTTKGLGPGGDADAVYKLTPVPEPATMLLLGSGLIGIAVIGRKKFFRK